jgi:hypothetical protein
LFGRSPSTLEPGAERWRSGAARVLVALGVLATLGAVVALAAFVSPEHRPSEALRAPPSSPVVLGRSVARHDARAGAREAGQRFLRAYVAFLYGRRAARDLPSATANLRSHLRRTHIRVPPARAERTPTISALRVDACDRRFVQVSVPVDDGDLSPYRIRAIAERRGRRWLVVRVTDQ